jgi:hypothetical protein
VGVELGLPFGAGQEAPAAEDRVGSPERDQPPAATSGEPGACRAKATGRSEEKIFRSERPVISSFS